MNEVRVDVVKQHLRIGAGFQGDHAIGLHKCGMADAAGMTGGVMGLVGGDDPAGGVEGTGADE